MKNILRLVPPAPHPPPNTGLHRTQALQLPGQKLDQVREWAGLLELKVRNWIPNISAGRARILKLFGFGIPSHS